MGITRVQVWDPDKNKVSTISVPSQTLEDGVRKAISRVPSDFVVLRKEFIPTKVRS